MAVTDTLDYQRVTTVGDFFALLKPRVMSLVVFTGLAGIIVAPGHVHPLTAFTALLCIALAAGASGALNMAYDSDIDGVMTRTATRPIPMGRIRREDAMAFGWAVAAMAVATMWLFVNELAAGLLAFTVFFYVVVYTLGLKRRTPQNIVIGGLAGALPPAIGWASVTGGLTLAPIVLVAIIFMWTPPHFWALSLWRCEDYARAGVPMLPVVKGKRATRIQIFLYSLLLAPLGMLPAFIGLGGILYLVLSATMGFWMLLEAFATLRERDEAREPAAKRLFGVSLLYVFVPFAALIAERLLHLPPLWT
jgi:protoheme IX farnesyltransferase